MRNFSFNGRRFVSPIPPQQHGALQLAFSSCASSLGYAVGYQLVNEQSGASMSSGTTCSTKSISALPGGQYRIIITRSGKTGTYKPRPVNRKRRRREKTRYPLITVHNRVWEAWRELEQRIEEPEIVLLFSSELSSDEALLAVRQAASEAVRELGDASAVSGEEEHRTGQWTVAAAVPGGIAIRIDEEPSDFRRLVEETAGRLEAFGVEGSFDLYEPQPVGELAEQAHLFECRLRVRGARHHFRGPNWRVLPEEESLMSVVEAGIDWCAGNAPTLPLMLKVRTMPAVYLRSDDDVRAHMRQGLEVASEIGVVQLTSAAPDRFRTLVVKPLDGRVSLVEGGAIIEARGWEPTLRSLRSMLARTSEWIVYGFIKRGSYLSAAKFGYLTSDWSPGMRYTPGMDDYTAPFEDSYAPDAFGVQLLGPGYAGRVPQGPDWNHIPVGADRVIVEHRDPAAWFKELFVPFGGRPNDTLPPIPPGPDVLARARKDFDEILFRDDIAWHAT